NLILAAVYLVPGVLYQKLLLPKIHRWANKDKLKLEGLYFKGNVSMLLVGGAVAVVLYYISPFLIPVLFGHEYLPSVSLLSILCISIPLRFLSSNLGAVLVVKENMRNKVLAMGGVACIFVVMTIILVPVY